MYQEEEEEEVASCVDNVFSSSFYSFLNNGVFFLKELEKLKI